MAGLMPDLSHECGDTQSAFYIEAGHCVIQHGHKNAGNWAGVREDLQQLLRCDQHAILQAKNRKLNRRRGI
ncbi:hypothetical protein D3C84_1310830 [compost metagenome]